MHILLSTCGFEINHMLDSNRVPLALESSDLPLDPSPHEEVIKIYQTLVKFIYAVFTELDTRYRIIPVDIMIHLFIIYERKKPTLDESLTH